MIEAAIFAAPTPFRTSIDTLTERIEACESRKGETSEVMALKVEVADLRKDVDYLKSTNFTSLLVAADDVDSRETSVIPPATTGDVHSHGTIVDESEAETDEEQIDIIPLVNFVCGNRHRVGYYLSCLLSPLHALDICLLLRRDFPHFLFLHIPSSPSLHSIAVITPSVAFSDWSREELPPRASPIGAATAASFPSLFIISFSFKPRYFVWIDHGVRDGLNGIFYNSMHVDEYNMLASNGQIRVEHDNRVEHDRVHEMINDAFGVEGGMEPE
ncbi:hypothetical protein H5410_045615 [Solanum commersonii]|uniref:Uncharacterized protein n=1 Tax=Solanum commersonii TaxID=4109 RepID=A0A9J5XC45_SOLCO|nr:hypothetical protein H5410_045615 [Solanum commersonii]